ncbi:MAG: hypothetical protein EAZ80_08515 [Runella slithyformis]|nr:MAG: hypothetical protein EAZ80_08515 [Runella slithyformis]
MCGATLANINPQVCYLWFNYNFVREDTDNGTWGNRIKNSEQHIVLRFVLKNIFYSKLKVCNYLIFSILYY